MAEPCEKKIPLSRTTKFVVDNRGRTAPTSSSGIALIATNCISNDDLYPTYKNVRYVSGETYREWFRSHPEPGDIILTLKGSQNGAVCLVPAQVDFAIAQDMVALRPDDKTIDPLFLFAALRSRAVQEQIRNLDVSGVIPHLKKGDFDKLFLPYPDRYLQEFIGHIYFSLCNKIELNRRMNETLEAMARAIFKDWFVDFGPTRAKMECRAPYLEPDIWSLFPDRLDDEGKPEGWNAKPLDQVADFLNGLALQKFPANGSESLPVIKIAQLRASGVASADRASTEIPPDYVVEDGDVLFSWSGSLLHRVWTAGRGALNQHLFKVTSKSFPKWFYFHWIAEHMPSFQAIAASKATTMGHIQRHHLTQATTFVATPDAMGAADELISPLFERQIANDLESRTLAAIRDFLLPKLMSGEIHVRDAEKLVGEAT
ncbi:restriction endonuclease subunit S [Rhizobium sp. P28RR-XV]|uniref:restriction endonuclease subunit S n=1 Tax=Rhizobium sp. P28RR-XV TaxID=2726737 RepID=UPI001457863B|nr:restriction endonuclease subunit S [Rhizobium sp. P28RR-XV]NLR85751.1 restriction endonuclease subunit S [Rhizobium sp. P28RR-XV]